MENRPLRPHRGHELETARRADRERIRLDTWNARSKYYERCEKQNAKFEQFTSPRYYAENNRLIADGKSKREKSERLVERREKLAKLFMEDQQTYDIETLMAACTPRSWEEDAQKAPYKQGEIPFELLKQVNDDVKASEERKQRHQAEVALYDQWKRDDPHLRDCERKRNLGEIKLSWLDQQVQKRMDKEREEQQMKLFIKERQEAIAAQRREEEQFKKEAEAKREKVRQCLEQQMDSILKREEESKMLRLEEDVVRRKRLELADLEAKWEADEKKRRAAQIALENQRFHQRKLQLKAEQVLQELEEDKLFIERLQALEVCEKVQNTKKRAEIQQTMNAFLGLVTDLKDLETKRKKHLQFTFDSEASHVYGQFDASWQKEEAMRRNLVQGILADLRQQIEDNLHASQEHQRQLLKEREEMLQLMQAQKDEMQALRVWEEGKKDEYRKSLDQQVQWKRAREDELKALEKEARNDEVEKLRSEEARLKEEIVRMQRKQNVPTYGRRRFFY